MINTGAKIVAKQVAKAALKEAVKVSVKGLASAMADKVGQYLTDAGSVTMAGQYAGYEWPFRCDKMPEYHITGGPGIARDENREIYLIPGPTFTVTKVNGCGNDMMLASPKRGTAKPNLKFPTQAAAPSGGGNSGVTPSRPAGASGHQEQACFNMVQGKVAWNQAGNTKWGPDNIKNLCRGSRNPQQTVACFQRGIASHNNWNQAIASCAGKF